MIIKNLSKHKTILPTHTELPCRVKLISTSDLFTNLVTGSEGSVTSIDVLGTVHVKWDNGSSLGLIPGEDQWLWIGIGDKYYENSIKNSHN